LKQLFLTQTLKMFQNKPLKIITKQRKYFSLGDHIPHCIYIYIYIYIIFKIFFQKYFL
jgi:hypothetical protein